MVKRRQHNGPEAPGGSQHKGARAGSNGRRCAHRRLPRALGIEDLQAQLQLAADALRDRAWLFELEPLADLAVGRDVGDRQQHLAHERVVGEAVPVKEDEVEHRLGRRHVDRELLVPPWLQLPLLGRRAPHAAVAPDLAVRVARAARVLRRERARLAYAQAEPRRGRAAEVVSVEHVARGEARVRDAAPLPVEST
eukprot:553392-Prymnesium_polylepis.2